MKDNIEKLCSSLNKFLQRELNIKIKDFSIGEKKKKTINEDGYDKLIYSFKYSFFVSDYYKDIEFITPLIEIFFSEQNIGRTVEPVGSCKCGSYVTMEFNLVVVFLKKVGFEKYRFIGKNKND